MDKLDKTAPANPEAEEAVLGSLLIDPDAVLKVASFLEAEDFYRERNGWVYRAILDLHERREPADFVTLCDELERNNILQEIGGAAYITQLINNVPSAAYVEHYGRIVERTATLRRLIDAAGQIVAQYDGEPVHRARPTLTWRPGERIVDVYDLPLQGQGPFTPLLILYRAADGREVGRLALPGFD